MKNTKPVCCICGKHYDGYGNNPEGALDSNGNWTNWHANDRCCDECNLKIVIPGRIHLMLSDK